MKVSTGAVEATEVDIRPRNSELVSEEEVRGSLEQNNVDYSVERKKSLRARYSYGIIFLVTNLIAWFVRDYGQRLLPQLHCKTMFFPSQFSSPSNNICICCRYLIIYSYIVKWRSNDSVLAFFCRSKSLWNWGARLFSNTGSSSCEFRMFCIFLLIV